MQKPLIVTVKSPGFGDKDVHVVSADGHDSISTLFAIDLLVTCTHDLDHSDVLESALTVAFTKDGKLVREVHGMAASIREIVTAETDQRNYRLQLVPRMWKGTLNERIDIYMDMSVPEIVQKKLEEISFKLGDDFMFKLRGSYDKREFVVQYRESDVAFISRLTEQLGISFCFEHTSGRDVVVFSDDNSAFQPIAADFRVGLRTAVGDFGVQTLESRTTHTPGKYVVRDYNYRTPSVDLTGDKDIRQGSGGVIVEYGAHFKTPDEGKWYAGVRAQEIETQRFVHDGTGTDARFRAGSTFTLEGHPRGELELLITDVTHRVRQAGMGGASADDASYEMTFSAIAQTTTYRPPRRTPKPKVHGVLTGVIDTAAKGQYAELDPEGRYRVKFLYDTAETSDALASRPVRMAQPHSGAGYGMHFPLRQGVEVVLTCVDGDPDRPIIASTVPNASTPSPVAGGNNARNIIRTGGGNEINIDDTDGQHRIKLSTPHHGTIFQIGSPNYSEDGAALATQGAYTTSVKDITGVITSASAALDHISTMFSRDIISTASFFKLDAKFVAKTIDAIFKVAKGFVSSVNNQRKIEQTEKANAAAKATAGAVDAKNKLESAKDPLKRLPPSLRDPAVERQTALETKQTELRTANQTLHDAKVNTTRLEGELETLEAKHDAQEGSTIGDDETGEQVAAKKRAIADSKASEGRAEDAIKLKESEVVVATKARDMGLLMGQTLGDLTPSEIKKIKDETTSSDKAQNDAAEATREKAELDKHIASDGWTKAASTMDTVDAAIAAASATGKLVSSILKVLQKVQKAGAISQAESMFFFAKVRARRSVYTPFTAGVPSTPFNIVSSDFNASLISKASTLVGSIRSTTVTGNKVGVTAANELVMTSQRNAEIHGSIHAALTSNHVVDVFSKKNTRVVAHSDKHLKPTGKPDLFMAAKGEIEVASTADSIRAYAENAITMTAKKNWILMDAKEEGFWLRTKTSSKIGAEDGVYMTGASAASIAGAKDWGAVFDSVGSFIGKVTTDKEDPKHTAAIPDHGVSVAQDKIMAMCGDSGLVLTKSGDVLVKGKSMYEAKVGGTKMEITKSKVLIG